MPKFEINEAGDAELLIDKDHVLIIHTADEGIVLDVFPLIGKPTRRQVNKDTSNWSACYLYEDMLPVSTYIVTKKELYDQGVRIEVTSREAALHKVENGEGEVIESLFEHNRTQSFATWSIEKVDD